MAAGGGERPPRRDALDGLLARIAARDAELARGVTLAGARIRIRDGAWSVRVARRRRAGTRGRAASATGAGRKRCFTRRT